MPYSSPPPPPPATPPSGLPAVGLVMVCRDAKEFVAESVESALAQDYEPLELVVVDDGSTDRTWEIVEGLRARAEPSRMRTIRAGAIGPTAAKNLGARESRGRFLCFFDSDDLLSTDAVSAMVEALDGGAREDAIAALDWRRIERIAGEWRRVPAGMSMDPPDGDPLRGWIAGWFVPPCALLWPRAALERAGGWDETLRQNDDGDLAMRALLAGIRIVRAKRGEAFYRRHDPLERISMSARYDDAAALRSRATVLDNAERRVAEAGLSERYRLDLARAWHTLARNAWLGDAAIARECDARARRLAGRASYHGSLPHRAGCLALGLERKEAAARALSRLGFSRRLRRVAKEMSRRSDGSGGEAAR